MIVLNIMNRPDVGFKTNTNKVTVFVKDGEMIDFDLKPKSEVASDIVNVIYSSLVK